MALFEMRSLSVSFSTPKGELTVVEDVSLSLESGKTLGLVGESGSGKSVSAMSILRLLGRSAKIKSGSILFEGQDLTLLSEREMRRIRGNKISMIFQEPMTALNPVFTIEKQLAEPLRIHQGVTGRDASARSLALLRAVGIPDAEGVLKRYPHALSGGMRQRVMIAMALACRPSLLIADEPTTALDVTVQAEILALMKRLQHENRTALLFITHDLAVIREMADTVAVMYCGRVVEEATVQAIFGESDFSHPYTEGLLACRPLGKRMQPIRGAVPPPDDLPHGCKFAPRCPYATSRCEEGEPPLYETEAGHRVRCYYPKKEERQHEPT